MDVRISMLSQESSARQGVCCSSILMAAQGVAVHGSLYWDAVLVLSYWCIIVHRARLGKLDGVHNGEGLSTDKYVATGRNSATRDWIAKPTTRLPMVVYWVKRLTPIA